MASAQLFPRIVSAKIDGRTQNIRYRQTQFHRLQSILVRHVDEITSAIQADSGHTPEEVQAEIGLAMKEIRSHYLSMKLEKDLDEEYAIAHGKDNMNRRRGVGIVYIVPSMHAMFYSVVSTLSAAMASGNCVIIEVRSCGLKKGVLEGAKGLFLMISTTVHKNHNVGPCTSAHATSQGP